MYVPRPPDDRLNWMNGDNVAVVYTRPDNAGNPALHVYCISGDGGQLGLVITAANLAGVPAQPESNTLVLSSSVCDLDFYVLTTGEYQINMREAATGRLYVMIMNNLAGAGAYFYKVDA